MKAVKPAHRDPNSHPGAMGGNSGGGGEHDTPTLATDGPFAATAAGGSKLNIVLNRGER